MPAATAIERKEAARALCEILGPRAAARRLGIPEGTVTRWSSKEHWPMPAVMLRVKDYAFGAALSQGRAIAHEARDQILEEHSKETKLYVSAAALKASYDAAQATGKDLRSKEGSMGMLNVARTADITHGWSAERAQPTQIQVAAVIMPTAEERAERRATDAKLDAIAAELRARALPAP